MTTLYKKDTKGKIRYLKIYTKDMDLIQESGVLDTDSPVVHRKTCKGKNIGKSNETVPEDQAVSEMNSKIAEKLTEGYFRTLKEVETEEVILPMLAKSYEDEKHKIDWNNCFIQPKLDGQRALDRKDGLFSRDGKLITTVNHISSLLEYIPFKLDGELYIHGLGFQENMKLIKKYRPGETEKVKYHVYDTIHNQPFINRYKILSNYKFPKEIIVVPTYQIKTEQELKKYHQQFISEGYEGSIIRHGNDGYKVNGRSSSLLKYKDFQDIACEIIDIESAEQRPEWGVPVFNLKGKEFRAGTKMSYEDRIDLLKNKKNYIGKTAEIRFFEYTDDGVPRFPVMVGIRLDK